jgi:hypothetical protein
LARLDDIRLEGIVIQIQLASDNLRVAIGYSDGRWDIRDRTKLTKLPTNEHPDKVYDLSEEGFGFRGGEPCTLPRDIYFKAGDG